MESISLVELANPVIAAPVVRIVANALARQFGGKPAAWGAGLALLFVGIVQLALAESITPVVVVQALVFSLLAFAGAFTINEYLDTRAEVRGVSGSTSWVR